MRRQIRLSAQYAVCTGLFVYLSLSSGQPLYVLVVYAVFLLWVATRMLGARRITGTMPRIIEKYEARIHELRSEIARGDTDRARYATGGISESSLFATSFSWWWGSNNQSSFSAGFSRLLDGSKPAKAG